jgi:hypothetical protein
MFISLPNFVSLFNNLCLPLIHVDGAYANNTLYGGTIIMLLSTHGYKIHLNKSSIYQVIGPKKAKYLREVADTYCMVSSAIYV